MHALFYFLGNSVVQLGLSKTLIPNKLEFLRGKKTSSHCAVAAHQDNDEIAVGLLGTAQLRDKELTVKQELQVPGLVYNLYISNDYADCDSFDDEQFLTWIWTPESSLETNYFYRSRFN